MDSFTAEDVEDPIQIFTDSKERVPQLDDTVENPFYGETAAPVQAIRRSKRKQVSVPGEAAQTIDEALSREDGMVYVL
jgi:hypothetical protein